MGGTRALRRRLVRKGRRAELAVPSRGREVERVAEGRRAGALKVVADVTDDLDGKQAGCGGCSSGGETAGSGWRLKSYVQSGASELQVQEQESGGRCSGGMILAGR